MQTGFTSNLYILPLEHFAIAIVTNLEGGRYLGLDNLSNQIADIMRQ